MQAAIGEKIEFKRHVKSPYPPNPIPIYKGEVIGFCVKLDRSINGGAPSPQGESGPAEYAVVLADADAMSIYRWDLINVNKTIAGFLAHPAAGGRRKTHRKSKSARKTHRKSKSARKTHHRRR